MSKINGRCCQFYSHLCKWFLLIDCLFIFIIFFFFFFFSFPSFYESNGISMATGFSQRQKFPTLWKIGNAARAKNNRQRVERPAIFIKSVSNSFAYLPHLHIGCLLPLHLHIYHPVLLIDTFTCISSTSINFNYRHYFSEFNVVIFENCWNGNVVINFSTIATQIKFEKWREFQICQTVCHLSFEWSCWVWRVNYERIVFRSWMVQW